MLQNNYDLELCFDQFEFYFNALSSLASIKTLVFLHLTQLVFHRFTYSIFSCLCHKVGKIFMYKLDKYFVLMSICKSPICQSIKLLSLNINQ